MAEKKSPPAAEPETGRFLPGNNGGPGRPKGSRNKLGEAFLADMYDAWGKHGVKAIEKTIKEKPDVFVRVVAGILPKELVVKDELSDMDDEELGALVFAARQAIAAAEEVGRRAGKASKPQQAKGVQTLQ